MATVVSKQDIDMILSLTPENVTRRLVLNLIAYREGKGQKYSCQSIVVIEKNTYHNNQEPIETTLGRLILNKLLFENFYGLLGYINDPLTKKRLDSIEDILSNATLNDIITVDDYIDYLNKFEWFGFSFAVVICNGFSYDTLSVNPKVKKRKKELLKEYADEIARGDVITGIKMRDELMAIAKEDLKQKNDPGLTVYESGSKSSFENQYGNMFVMKGALKSNTESRWNVSTNSLLEGIPIEEHHIYGDSLVTSAYGKGVGTQVGGYMTKQFFAAFQTLVLDLEGTDCGSKGYLELEVDDFIVPFIIYRYIIEGSKLKLLTDSNIKSYVGKTIRMRSPCFCVTDHICNMCAGELYYKLGIYNIGLTTVRVSSTILGASMKGFHDSTVKLYDISPEDIL